MSLCQKCHERVATVFITKVAQDDTTKVRLCETCAREQAIEQAWLGGLELPPDSAEMPLDELMQFLFAQAEESPETLAAFGEGIGARDDEEKWSLQSLAAYDHLQKTGEFSGDEDLDDEADEMDESDAFAEAEFSETEFSAQFLDSSVSPEELEAALEAMTPEERDAVGDMLETLDEVQEELEAIMQGHALDAGLSDRDSDGGPLPHEAEAGLSEMFGEESEAEFEIPAPSAKADWSAANTSQSAKGRSTVRCPKCQTSWDRLREDGRAGCATCYSTFEDSLGEVLGRMQQSPQHVGKAPRAATRRKRRLEHLRARRDHRLEMLRGRLQTALEKQDYEEAAKLRDKIKIVESTIVEPES